ncbi:MAG: DsbA family protein [Geminicoccaceae bacterium]
MKRRSCLAAGAGLAMAGLALPAPSAQATELVEQVLGDPAAPVEIIEYASLTCPHCAAFQADTLPELKKRYIDTGKAKLVMRDFPLDQSALFASALAHCAGPDRYFTFIDALFSSQTRWARAADPKEALVQLAQLGGMSREQAEACLADEALMDAILQVRLDGQNEYGINSTPSFVVNGKKLTGNHGIENFAEVIDAAAP